MNLSTRPGTEPARQFDFGQNWKDYARHAITPERLAAAEKEFAALHAAVPLQGRSFLDIGFGQGISLLLARKAGAHVVGGDINPKCAEALAITRHHFPQLAGDISTIVGSILQPSVVERLRAASPAADGGYDIVHSWGVLHHTGDMDTAIRHASSLVRPGGHLVLAIYNRHWSSRPWLWIKWAYVHAPGWVQRAFIALLTPVIFAAKWLVTRRDPREQERGMDFHYNVVDWVGGYPYEYASQAEMCTRLAALGFRLQYFRAAQVPTGCNEFVFQAASSAASAGPRR